jgi:signal transduction histidine kinase
LARVSHIAKQTLGFYKESSTPQPVDVPMLVQEVVRLYQSRITAKGGSLHFEHFGAKVVSVAAAELRQVVSNLVGNSVDAIGMNGTIWVRVHGASTGVRVSVADNGMGISPGIKKKIFEPFFTTKRDVGTGLGLWVSAQLVAQHNGSIRMRSRTNDFSGTVFSVFLPDSRAKVEKRKVALATAIRASA